MGDGALTGLFEVSAIAWTGALFGLVIGALEWLFLPRLMETSIRGSREARKLNRDQLEGVISWWKTTIRVFAVSMPLLGFGLAAAMAD
ncbi:hypothetical protein [Ancylobacter amanitiformis]|uniref:Uncharacterized protein n=1 Tax=Ancylobacter amanitiformis TaxID=217069 RepID=A0ABU0LUC9_9HYPH|nr:hypothetical protein [Ancylobacter amanitiformis]MDQ0512337.1 hypothetical protein [Ancylobacter amanitiformis]